MRLDASTFLHIWFCHQRLAWFQTDPHNLSIHHQVIVRVFGELNLPIGLHCLKDIEVSYRAAKRLRDQLSLCAFGLGCYSVVSNDGLGLGCKVDQSLSIC